MTGALDIFANETRYGFLAMNVADIGVVADWYHQMAGFTVLRQDDRHALLGLRGNQQSLLALRQPPAWRDSAAVAGLAAVTVMVPNRQVIGSVYDWFNTRRVPILNVFQTGLSAGLTVRDPAGNRISFAYDEASGDSTPVRYDWRDLVERPAPVSMVAPIRGSIHRDLPAGTRIGAATLAVAKLAPAIKYLTEGIGFTLQGQTKATAWLTVGDQVHHIGLTLVADAALPPRQSDDLGLDYLNVILPTAQTLQILARRLDHAGLGIYHYDEARQYLNATGPNGIMFWFSVA